MRKKEKWLLFVMPSLVKMRLSRLVSRDNRIIIIFFRCLCPEQRGGISNRPAAKKSCRTSCAAALAMPGLFLDADGAYRAALSCGDGLRHLLRRDGPGSATARTPPCGTRRAQPGALVQPMHSSGSTNAFMQTPPCGKHCPFCRKLCLCKRFTVWYNKTAGNRQEEIR